MIYYLIFVSFLFLVKWEVSETTQQQLKAKVLQVKQSTSNFLLVITFTIIINQQEQFSVPL